MQNDKVKFKMIKGLPLILVLVVVAHFLYRQSTSQVAGTKDIAIDWDTIDPLISLLLREIYAAAPGKIDPMAVVREFNHELYPEDQFKFVPDPALGLGSLLSVQRALPVLITDGHETKLARTWQKTVAGLLVEQSIAIGEQDQLSPSPDIELKPDLKITIVRVSETEVKENESINFTTKTKNDPELAKGVTKIEQKGQKGQRAKYYLVRRENGQTVEKKFLRQEIVKEPLDEIVLLGTKVIILGQGKATWFGAPTLTAAHNSLPRGSKVRVINLKNGQSVVVKIIGGGIQRDNVVIDLAPDAFKQLAPLAEGVISVRLEKE